MREPKLKMHRTGIYHVAQNMIKLRDFTFNIPASEIGCDANIGFDWGVSGKDDEINTP